MFSQRPEDMTDDLLKPTRNEITFNTQTHTFSQIHTWICVHTDIHTNTQHIIILPLLSFIKLGYNHHNTDIQPKWGGYYNQMGKRYYIWPF